MTFWMQSFTTGRGSSTCTIDRPHSGETRSPWNRSPKMLAEQSAGGRPRVFTSTRRDRQHVALRLLEAVQAMGLAAADVADGKPTPNCHATDVGRRCGVRPALARRSG